MPPKKQKNATKQAQEQKNDGNEKSSEAKSKSTSETIKITITTKKSPSHEDNSEEPKKKAKMGPRNGKTSKKTESVASKPKPSSNTKTEKIKVSKRTNTVIQSEPLSDEESTTTDHKSDGESEDAESEAPASVRTKKEKKAPAKKTTKAPVQTSKQGASLKNVPSRKRMKLQKIFVTLNTPEAPGKTTALACGDNEAGQLGMEISEANRFKEITNTGEKVVECAAGGMHSLLLTEKGNVYSFGCNDDGSLGRHTEDEEECFKPGLVQLADHKVAKIAVGSLHSVAITTECRVFLWGNYRDNNGPFGILPDNERHAETPFELNLPELIVDVACGADHTLLLGAEGNVYTMGCAEHGRLGRIRKSHCCRENRRARQVMLTPNLVRVVRKRKQLRFDRVWAGRYTSYIRSMPDGAIFGFGLNNFHQLGRVESAEKNDNFVFEPVELEAFDPKINWSYICGGEQHTLALDAEGTVYSMGRPLYGRLGFGQASADDPDIVIPKVVPGLEKSVDAIAAGDHCSFALNKNGQLYCWGEGANILGQGTKQAEEIDIFVPTICTSKALKGKTVIHISAGCSHALSVILD